MVTIAFESKRLFGSGTGFGTYGRTLLGDLAPIFPENSYTLFASDAESDVVNPKNPTYREIVR